MVADCFCGAAMERDAVVEKEREREKESHRTVIVAPPSEARLCDDLTGLLFFFPPFFFLSLSLTFLLSLSLSSSTLKKKNQQVKWGGNGKADFLKKVEDVADGDACAKICSETGGCQHYKYCYLSGNGVCTNHWSKGGPDTPFKTCELYKNKFTPAVDDGTYGGFILGLDCSGSSGPTPEIVPIPMPVVTPISMGPSVFKNLKGDLLKRHTDFDFGQCMDACKKDQGCAGINFCSGLQPSPNPKETVCSGDIRRGVCDLKKFEGEASFWDDSTAQAGDGWMSSIKQGGGTAVEKQPRK